MIFNPQTIKYSLCTVSPQIRDTLYICTLHISAQTEPFVLVNKSLGEKSRNDILENNTVVQIPESCNSKMFQKVFCIATGHCYVQNNLCTGKIVQFYG